MKGKSILAPLFKCLESMFELFVPLVIARMIDQGIRKENLAVIWHSLFSAPGLSLCRMSYRRDCPVFCGRGGYGGWEVLSKRLVSQNSFLTL